MGKENQDGLIMDQSFFMIDEKKPGFPISARAIQFLAIIIGGWCFISVLLECLAIPVNVFQVNAALFICTGIMFTFCLIPSYDLVKLFFCILFYGLFFYSRLPKLANGFYIIENLVVDRLASYYNYQSIYYMADYTKESADTTLLVVMLIIPVVALLTMAIVRNRLVGLCSFILFLPISASFLFGLIPAEKYLVAYVAAILYLARSGVSNRNMSNKDQKTLLHRINSRAAVWLSLLGISIFFILKIFLSEKDYNNISEIKDMKNDVQTAFMDFSVEDITNRFTDIKLFDSSNMTIGGLSGGKLGKTGLVEFADSDQLVVTLPYESAYEGIYLKGYVGSEYTGNSWEEHSKDDEKKYKELQKNIPVKKFPPVNQTYQLLNLILDNGTNETKITTVTIPQNLAVSFMPIASEFQIYKGKLQIEYKDANKKFIYAPYFTNYEMLDEAFYKQDLYIAPKKKNKKYEFDYYFNLFLGYPSYAIFTNLKGQLGSYPDYEQRYRDYVYDVYTKLPEKGLERLKEDFTEDKLQTMESGVANKVAFVQNYLAENTTYTLSPGKLPKGKDFVEYFLYENKKGYCAHYASAATLMLRAMGVPARYVEGYAVGPSQVQQDYTDASQTITAYTGSSMTQYDTMMTEITVKDYNAHAWVEVYIDGCGWIPVEATPGSAIATNSSMLEDLSQAKYYINQGGEKEITPTKEPAKPTTAAKEQEINKRTTKPDQKPSPTTAPDKTTQDKLDFAFLITFVLLTAVGVTLFITYKIRKRNNIIHSSNRNKRAIYLFMEVEKLLSFCHGLPEKGARLEDSEEYVKENSRYVESKEFDTCMETIKKARFGREKITIEELREVEAFHRQLYNEVYEKLPFIGKMHLNLIILM